MFKGNAQDLHESIVFYVPVSHFPSLFDIIVALFLRRNSYDFYLVYTSIRAPILAPNFKLLGSSIAFVGDQKLTRFRLSFFVVFDPKMAPKSDSKTCTKITFLHPVLRPKFLTPPGPFWASFGLHLGLIWLPFWTPF